MDFPTKPTQKPGVLAAKVEVVGVDLEKVRVAPGSPQASPSHFCRYGFRDRCRLGIRSDGWRCTSAPQGDVASSPGEVRPDFGLVAVHDEPTESGAGSGLGLGATAELRFGGQLRVSLYWCSSAPRDAAVRILGVLRMADSREWWRQARRCAVAAGGLMPTLRELDQRRRRPPLV